MIEQLLVGMLGAIVGSFLNVCIHRLPREESIVTPGSHCPKCKKPILWHDNIPVVSYLILRGKCRVCKEKISMRYLLVELITAFFFLLFFNYCGLGLRFIAYLVFVCGLIVATFVDFDYRIIPDEISLGGIAAGLFLSALKGLHLSSNTQHSLSVSYNPSPILNSFWGVIIGGGVIYLTGFFFDLVYFKLLKKPAIQGETSSMGGGDVKLLAMIGAFLGWQSALLTFFLAPFFGAVVGVVNLISKKDHTIAYGPFLSLASLVTIFWADKIIALILLR